MDKIYVGNAKEKETQYGKLLSVTLELDKLIKEFNNHGFVTKQGERKIKVTVLKMKEVGTYGDTHYLLLDQWHPDTYNKPKPITLVQGPSSEKPKQDEDPVF